MIEHQAPPSKNDSVGMSEASVRSSAGPPAKVAVSAAASLSAAAAAASFSAAATAISVAAATPAAEPATKSGKRPREDTAQVDDLRLVPTGRILAS